MSGTEPLTRKRLKELLDYNPETGIFVWKERKEGPAKWNTRWAGKVAGAILRPANSSVVYLKVRIGGYFYLAHRLAFFYVKGYWPDQVDHANGVGTDNRWKNLNNVTPADNNGNCALSSNSSTGISGVGWSAQKGKYRVRVTKNGKEYYGGFFTDKTEAAKKARELYIKLGFHPNHGLTRKRRASQ